MKQGIVLKVLPISLLLLAVPSPRAAPSSPREYPPPPVEVYPGARHFNKLSRELQDQKGAARAWFFAVRGPLDEVVRFYKERVSPKISEVQKGSLYLVWSEGFSLQVDPGTEDWVQIRIIQTRIAKEEDEPEGAGEAPGEKTAVVQKSLSPETKEWREVYRSARLRLDAKEYEALEETARKLRKTKARLANGQWMLVPFYKGIEAREEKGERAIIEQITKIEDWIREFPASITPRVAKAELQYELAYLSRGTEWAKHVTPEGWKRYARFLADSAATLAAADKLEPKCPVYYDLLIRLGRSMGLPRTKFEMIYKKALSFESDYPDIYLQTAIHLMPKWHGELGDWEQFLIRTTRADGKIPRATVFSNVVTEIIKGHPPYGAWGENLFKESKIDWPLLRTNLELRYKEFPDSIHNLDWYLIMAFNAGDKQTAAKIAKRYAPEWKDHLRGLLRRFNEMREIRGLDPVTVAGID